MKTLIQHRECARAIGLGVGLALLAGTQGCKQGADYARPATEAPAGFRNGPTDAGASSIADLPWWSLFKDAELQALIREALASNYDLRIAVSRIDQARAVEAQTVSPLYPQVGYQGALGGGRNSFLGNPSPNGGNTNTSALLNLNAVWEIDLWGRIARADEAALAQILAAEEARRGVMLTLVTSVAQAYFELLELDLELQIAHQNVEAFQKTLDLFTRRSTGGVDSKLQVLRAQADLSQVATTIPEIERQITIKENEIALLLGKAPGPVKRGAALLAQEMPVDIPVGLPSDLMQRRPDILAAEQLLVSANAQIGVAQAGYFPRIGLTAFLGKVSPELKNFNDSGSNAWAIAGDVAGPIFTGGRIKGEVDLAKAQRDEALNRYKQTINAAFGEVANTLVTREKLIGVETELKTRVSALKESVGMARERFDVGKANYFEILDAQQKLYPAETALARTRADQYIAVIQLYKTLGGGWNMTVERWTATAP